jgi:hypothetical protein
MVKRAIFVFLILFSLVGAPRSWADPLWRGVGDRVAVSGSKTYSVLSLSVAGNRDVFYDDNYGFSPRYRNETNLTLAGSLFSGLSVTATLSNNRWNPNDRTVAFNYQRGKTKASMGDITASLSGNELVSFSRRLQGATITQDLGVCSVTAIASRTKAATRTVSLAGNNTPGPYYLGASQIVDGSERVKIDEREILRSDSSGVSNYTFDSFSGILTFRDGLIVPSTSTIAVSFETQSYNSTPGSIWGLRTDVPVGKRAGIGLTYLTQQSNRDSEQIRQITEPFPGNNSLSWPYELLYIPLEGSVTVKVDGLLQIPPADYTINYPLHYVLFTRPIPSSSTILVTYIPQPERAVSADRSVMGLDARLKVSDGLTLTGQFARSTRDYSGLAGGGAATLRAVGKYGKLNFTANLRSIDKSFAPVETAGFFRNERGGNLDLRYIFSEGLSGFMKVERFRRPDYQSTNQEAAGVVTATQSVSGFEWKPARLPQVRLSRTRIDSTDGADYRDGLSTDALTVNWGARKFSATGELSRSSRSGSYLSSATKSLVLTGSSADTSRLSLRYLPGERFSLVADVARSKISASQGSGSEAKNYQLTANFIPARTVNLAMSYRVADSGGGYSNAYGYGGSTSIGSGYPVGTYISSFGLRTVSRTVTLDWNASARLSIDTSYNYSYAEGENNTNTAISGMDLGFTLSPLNVATLRGHLSRQNGSFIGSSGDMSSRIGLLMLNLGPIRKFELDLNYQKMLSGTRLGGLAPGDPLYAYQNSTVNMRSINAVLRRAIGGGRYLFTEYLSSSAAGLVANSKSALAFGVEYPLNQILGLKLDWRIIDYTDSRNPGNNYRANMLNAQLGARFR